jgi:hypothetical protein
MMGGGINLTPVSFLQEVHSLGSSFCETSIKFLPRFCMDRGGDKRQAHLLSFQSNPWQEFDGASSVFFVGMS